MPLSICSFVLIFFLLKRIILTCLNSRNVRIYFFIVKLVVILGLVHVEDTFSLVFQRVYPLKTLQYGFVPTVQMYLQMVLIERKQMV